MGNSNKKFSVQELLAFVHTETEKWTRILAQINGEEEQTPEWESNIFQEFDSTKNKWKWIGKKMRQNSLHYDEKTVICVCEKDIKRYKNHVSFLKSDNDCLQQRIHLLETQLKENEKKIPKLEQCVSELNQRRQEEYGASKHASVVDSESTSKPNHLECEQNIKTLQNQMKDRDNEISILKANIESVRKQNKLLEQEKCHLLLRVSKLSGERLVDNNPAITNLSDPNRPTKLGESFCELYDNEWTNAVEALQTSGYSENEAIETLVLTLMNIYKFCEREASLVLRKSTDAINLLFEEYKQSVLISVPAHLTVRGKKPRKRQSSFLHDIQLQQRWKPKILHKSAEISAGSQLVTSKEQVANKENLRKKAENKLIQLRKDVGVSMVPIVQEAYMKARWDLECLEGLRPFILKCLFITWMMVVQSPAMAFRTCQEDDKFETSMFKEYTKRGPEVGFMVWPALLLQKDGQVVCKGVAQGRNAK